MRNAAAPITGGTSWPPVEATASMAPATCAGNPAAFIIGMVMGPSIATLAAALPDTVPKRPELTTDTLAGPPRKPLTAAPARSVSVWLPPVAIRICPKRMKLNTMVEATSTVIPGSALPSR